MHECSEGPASPLPAFLPVPCVGFPFLSLLPGGATRHLRKFNFAPATAPAVAKLVRREVSLGIQLRVPPGDFCHEAKLLNTDVLNYLMGTEILLQAGCCHTQNITGLMAAPKCQLELSSRFTEGKGAGHRAGPAAP